jgi:hypothetical protein
MSVDQVAESGCGLSAHKAAPRTCRISRHPVTSGAPHHEGARAPADPNVRAVRTGPRLSCRSARSHPQPGLRLRASPTATPHSKAGSKPPAPAGRQDTRRADPRLERPHGHRAAPTRPGVSCRFWFERKALVQFYRIPSAADQRGPAAAGR